MNDELQRKMDDTRIEHFGAWHRHGFGTIDYSDGILMLIEETNSGWLNEIASFVESPEWEKAVAENEELFANSFWSIKGGTLEWSDDLVTPSFKKTVDPLPFDVILEMYCYPGDVAKLMFRSEAEFYRS